MALQATHIWDAMLKPLNAYWKHASVLAPQTFRLLELVMEHIRDRVPLPMMFVMLMERAHPARLVFEVTMGPRLIRIRDVLLKHLSASQKRVIV